jgi:hypothetical protein
MGKDVVRMKGKGYFILKDKNIDIGNDSHIGYLIKHPKMFNFSMLELQNIFNQFNEPFGIEGIASKVIKVEVIYQKWILVGQKGINEGLVIELLSLREQHHEVIQFLDWAMKKKEYIKQNDPIELIESLNNYSKIYLQSEGGAGKLLIEVNSDRIIY